jgi:hypothetical protein
LQHQQALQFFQVVGVRVGGVLGMAAQQVGDRTFEAAFSDGARSFDLWVVAAERWAVDPVEQQVALGRAQRADGHGRVENKAVVAPGGAQRLDIASRVERVPDQYSPTCQAFFIVKDPRQVPGINGPQPGADRACSGGFVEREEGHAHLGQ